MGKIDTITSCARTGLPCEPDCAKRDVRWGNYEFHSNLREVMLYIKYSKDKAKLDEIIETDSNFQNVERQAADVINVVTGSKLKYPEGKGDVNMCLAIQQMREESELIGQIKGAVLMCKNLGVSLTDTIKQIAEMFHLSESESNETVKQYW